ncbi:Sodium/hydrogen exchanger family-domain-containing protein [Corynascus novoguineensis]|uniref:Sodium/hydrogen exchanger family-domain-containing protein n=1 Tax=Corynascus novoguineensis TaxID=1126955 RepID=A0AAN7CX52_9PEZI|nr:Sodium/hydrogen exchanger family-domain-containing protein [Corynascus novoguineensis]
MRIPGFQAAIFPTESMPVFNNVANLGLVIFLFLVALEVDIRLFTQNWRAALSVGLAGMVLPFGLGFAIAWGIFNHFPPGVTDHPISFGVFGLFIGTALAITAFPVLCRILSELNLLRCDVGVTVLAAGIGNDVTGWILLALCVALVNNSSGLAALWALLCCIGWTLLLVFVVRPPFMWVLRRTGSLQNGPTQGMVALTMLMVLASAWFTGIIGVHPIFGAFLVGIICPHDAGFAIKLTEKIEDLISVLFLPLYFALSGLSTNLGLLNDGITWAYVIGVIACAFFGKLAGGAVAARANKLLWRESLAIGGLMSCKGLVELIVLNIGLQAGILSETTFTMFVVMALVTTLATTPFTKALYPPWYQKKVEKWRRGEIDWDGNPTHPSETDDQSQRKPVETQIRRLMVHLRLDSLPSLFTFITLLRPENVPVPAQSDTKEEPSPSQTKEVQVKKRPLEVHGLRVIELTDRTSSVMHLTEGEDFYSLRDPVVNTFRAFSQLHDIAVSCRVAVVPTDAYAETLVRQASETSSDFALIPWGEYGSMSEDMSFHLATSASDRFRSSTYMEFISQTLQKAAHTCNAGIFIDNGFGGVTKPADRPGFTRSKSGISIRSFHTELAAPRVADKSHHIFLPFLGGPDDRVALRIVLQLAKNRHVTASIVRVNWPNPPATTPVTETPSSPATTTTAPGTESTLSLHEQEDAAFFSTIKTSVPADLAPRVGFSEVELPSSIPASTALPDILSLVQKTVGQTPKNAGDMVILGRRNARFGDTVPASGDMQDASGNAAGGSASGAGPGGVDLRRTVGAVAEQLITAGVKASILIVQAGGRGLDTAYA